MKVEPLTTYRPKDFALLTPGRRCLYVETKWGKQLFQGERDVSNALGKLKNFTCYISSGLERLRNTTSARHWVLNTWRGTPVKMTHTPSGVVVTSLRSTLEGSDDPFRDLNEALGWLRQYGIPPASISSMSWKLLRASMPRSVHIGFDPEISSQAFFGGRQECSTPKVYSDMKLLDIHAAYPSAMASRDVALDLRLVHSSTTLDPSEAGLARASVFVPRELPHPPLPVRIGPEAIQFQWGHIKGVWSWVELDLARRLGCDVKVQEVWAPGRTTDLFGAWWGEAQTGRSLEGKASKLAKAIANSTWGQFAMRGDQRSEVSWADDRGNEEYEIELPPKSMPQRWGIHIASEITARVRTQMLEEGMYGIGGSIHADTDGVIVPVGSASPKNFGKGFGSWQTKELMKTVDLRAPQLYRFTRLADGAGDWKYVASGMRPDMARKIFEKGVLGTNISYLDISDKCLPPADADEQEMLDAIYKEAKSLGVL